MERNDTLEVLTTYASGVEAGFAQQILKEAGIEATLGNEAASTNLSHFGTALGDVRLLVSKSDVEDAAQILSDLPAIDEQELLSKGVEAGWWDDEADPEEDHDAVERAVFDPAWEPRLNRAFRAAIVGLPFFPLAIVSLYSIYLIFRHRLYLTERGGGDWRYYAALVANLAALFAAVRLWIGRI